MKNKELIINFGNLVNELKEIWGSNDILAFIARQKFLVTD